MTFFGDSYGQFSSGQRTEPKISGALRGSLGRMPDGVHDGIPDGTPDGTRDGAPGGTRGETQSEPLDGVRGRMLVSTR